MKIEKLKPGMTVYDVGKTKMGNTKITTVSVWPVYIISVDLNSQTVLASWNGNASRNYSHTRWSKWRLKEPKLIRTAMGSHRLAKRGEDAA